MNKFVTLSGLFLAAYLLYSFNIGTYGLNDVFSIIAENQEVSEGTEVGKNDGSNLSSFLIIDPKSDSDDLKSFVQEQLDGDEFKNMVVLLENPVWRGNNSIATLKSYEELEIFEEIDSGLEEDGLRSAFIDGQFIEIETAKNLVKTFETKTLQVLPVFVKDIASNEEMEIFAEVLSELDNTLIVSAISFSENLPNYVATFHDELSMTVIENLDKSGVAQLDVSNRPILFLTLSYLDKIESKKALFVKHNVREDGSGFFVKFTGEEVENDRNLTMLALGDVMLSRYVRTLMNQYGNDYSFENIQGYQKRFFEGADVVFANLEGPIKGQGTSGGTAMVFSFNEDSAPLLKNYGFNVVSIANNHAMDQGKDGRATTIAALEKSGLGWCGDPHDEDANSVYYGNVGEKKYAIICFQDVTSKINQEDAVNLVKEVRPNVDYLIVTPHWGYEYKLKADFNAQVKPGRAWIDAGADMVVGHHPHVVQNFEAYNGKLIFYSLGNFIFDQYWSNETQKQLGIGIVLDDANSEESLKTKVYLFPMKSEKSKPRLLTEGERMNWFEEYIKNGDYSDEQKAQIRNGVIEAQ